MANSSFTVDGIASGGSGSVTNIATTSPITGGPITTTGTIGLQHAGVTPGSYTNANITVDAFGIIQAASNGGGGGGGSVTNIATTAPIAGGPITTTGTISLNASGVVAGSYTYSSITVDAHGLITAASNGANPGAINSGSANQLAYYATNGTTLSGLAGANSAILTSTNVGVPAWSSPLTNGQIMIGSTGATPIPANIVAGANVTITNGPGSITIAATGGGSVAAYVIYDTTSGVMAVNNGSTNVTSLTYNSTGNVTINFTSPFPTAFYPAGSTSGKGASGYGGSVAYIIAPWVGNPTTTTYEAQTVGSTGGAFESPFAQFIFAI